MTKKIVKSFFMVHHHYGRCASTKFSGLGISMGEHRLRVNKTFKDKLPLGIFLSIANSMKNSSGTREEVLGEHTQMITVFKMGTQKWKSEERR